MRWLFIAAVPMVAPLGIVELAAALRCRRRCRVARVSIVPSTDGTSVRPGAQLATRHAQATLVAAYIYVQPVVATADRGGDCLDEELGARTATLLGLVAARRCVARRASRSRRSSRPSHSRFDVGERARARHSPDSTRRSSPSTMIRSATPSARRCDAQIVGDVGVGEPQRADPAVLACTCARVRPSRRARGRTWHVRCGRRSG